MMKVNRQLTSSYQAFLLDRLQNEHHAAGYLTAILEESDPEPLLFLSALEDVVAAKLKAGTLSEAEHQHYEMLHTLLSKSGESEIYAFVNLLNVLGLQLSVTVKCEP